MMIIVVSENGRFTTNIWDSTMTTDGIMGISPTI